MFSAFISKPIPRFLASSAVFTLSFLTCSLSGTFLARQIPGYSNNLSYKDYAETAALTGGLFLAFGLITGYFKKALPDYFDDTQKAKIWGAIQTTLLSLFLGNPISILILQDHSSNVKNNCLFWLDSLIGLTFGTALVGFFSAGYLGCRSCFNKKPIKTSPALLSHPYLDPMPSISVTSETSMAPDF